MSKNADPTDLRFMRAALALARRGLGNVWQNPAVGCVIVAGETGHVLGRGWTQPGGRPHAETEALRRAGDAARGATAYVSLEPCSHHGKTPPCTEALIGAGITRVVAAIEDPDPRVGGAGLEQLRAAGIQVDHGVCRQEAEELNAGHMMRLRHGRPMVCLKTATTLDGRIATHTGASHWITGPEARARGHLLRATHDAIMVGIGTVLADDPMLTCRVGGLETRSPIRIVVDPRLRLPLTSQLAVTAGDVPVWLVTLQGGDQDRAETLRRLGVEILAFPAGAGGYPDPAAVLGELAARGLTRVLVEGGATLAAVLLRAGLVDRIAWFRSGGIIGGDGIPAVEAYGIDTIEAMARFERRSMERLGHDLLETLWLRA